MKYSEFTKSGLMYDTDLMAGSLKVGPLRFAELLDGYYES